jgi:opacity protein-like surface antigen
MKHLTAVLILVCACNILPQPERLASMGDMKFIVQDKYVTLNPYDFGGNPAWLVNDDQESWLKMKPLFSGYSGDYKRRYDPGSENTYSLGFTGLKNLGSDGTFMGETSYEYNFRNEVPRSLKWDTYSGGAFFFTDTTTGNFRYNGPTIKFNYSFEPVNDLFTGASLSYRILDGLKDVYTRAEVLYRNIEANVGGAYQLADNLAFGVNYIYSDNQEKIESKSEDLMDVELYYSRGETYHVLKRSQYVNQKIKGSGNNLSAQVYYKPDISSEIAITGSYGSSGQRILMPFTFTDLTFKEYEEGYTSFNYSSVMLRSRYELFRSFFVGLTGGYRSNYVWSKHTGRDRLLWEWEVKDFTAGTGFSWQLNSSALVAVEYEFSNLNADSSKYIDARFGSIKSGNHQFRIGAEYEAVKDLFVRLGYNLYAVEKDIIFGGENIMLNKVTAGFGIYIFPSVGFDVHMGYDFYNGLPAGLKKSGYSAFTTVKLYSF